MDIMEHSQEVPQIIFSLKYEETHNKDITGKISEKTNLYK